MSAPRGLTGAREGGRAREGSLLLPGLLVLVGILLLLGFSGASQVSSSRQAFERLYARRLHLMIAESAFEEASARLEKMFDRIPFPGTKDIRTHRNLRTAIVALTGKTWPAQVPAPIARDLARENGVEIGAVAIRVADWIIDPAGQPTVSGAGQWTLLVQEVTIIEMTVPVSVTRGGAVLEGEVSARRYADVYGDAGDTQGKLRILPRDMVLRFPAMTF